MAKDSIVEHIFGIIDASVELYLVSIIKPFLKLHEKFYGQLNKVLNDLIEQHGPLPTWCTANFVTYARTMLVIPLLLFMSWGHR